MKSSLVKDKIAFEAGYLDWETMIHSISENGIDETKLRDILERYAILRVLQTKKHLAKEIIADCDELTQTVQYVREIFS